MLILILIDVQYSQTAVFSFEKGLNGQNYSSGSHYPVKKIPPPAKFPIPFPLGGPPPPLTAIWKTLLSMPQYALMSLNMPETRLNIAECP